MAGGSGRSLGEPCGRVWEPAKHPPVGIAGAMCCQVVVLQAVLAPGDRPGSACEGLVIKPRVGDRPVQVFPGQALPPELAATSCLHNSSPPWRSWSVLAPGDRPGSACEGLVIKPRVGDRPVQVFPGQALPPELAATSCLHNSSPPWRSWSVLAPGDRPGSACEGLVIKPRVGDRPVQVFPGQALPPELAATSCLHNSSPPWRSWSGRQTAPGPYEGILCR